MMGVGLTWKMGNSATGKKQSYLVPAGWSLFPFYKMH